MGFWSEAALHVLLPRACAHCRADIPFGDAQPLCGACRQDLPPPEEPRCARCEAKILAARGLCRSCTGRLFACRLIRAATPHRGPAAALVHAFKFRGLPSAARAAGVVLAREMRRRAALEGFDALVPVPLHPRRERVRGYNQAEVLAREVAAATGLAMLTILERPRWGSPSWRLGRHERRASLSGAFAVRKDASAAALGRRLMLIDDVCATGTTLEECARALRAAGAADVSGWVFARAGPT